MKFYSRPEYEEQTAQTRDARMEWWRDARFGMFVHYGLYSQTGRHEWQQTQENIPLEEYRKLADTFAYKSGNARKWAELAKKAGMKYMMLTSRHHEGFSLWDSKANPYNSVNLGPKCDIVKEYVEACREFGLRFGFYTSCMDWQHPDAWKAAFDSEARARFNKYILDINTELLTQYGKIDVLWYDVSLPMESWEGWNAVEINQKLRAIQPDIIINNRMKLEEDFGTPEEHIVSQNRDWEACMTFNGLSWGYVDSKQAAKYSYNAQGIIRMLQRCTSGGGNLLLNIGPTPDGDVPEEAIAPLTEVGKWLEANGKAVYGKVVKSEWRSFGSNGLCSTSVLGNSIYLWNWIWPSGGTMGVGGYMDAPKAVRLVHDGSPIDFEHKGHRIILKNLPETCPAPEAGITVIEMEFDKLPRYCFASYYPQLNGGREITADRI